MSSLKLQQGASAAELSAVGQLVMLTQRIGKSANEFLTMEGVSPEAVFLLGKDLNTFREIAEGLINGNAELRLPGTKDAADQASAWQRCSSSTRQTRTPGQRHPGQPAGPGDRARRPGGRSWPTASRCAKAWSRCRRPGRHRPASVSAPCSPCWRFRRADPRRRLRFPAAVRVTRPQRAQLAEAQRLEAERQEQEAKRVNDANQAAILRLMNELQTVAEGDLTQQATVTEDITGAIADSVNYTVEELRTLVAQVQGTVGRVTDTTQQVEQTSTELLATSDRAAARDSRHRRVGAADGRAHQRGVGPGPAHRAGGGSIAAGRRAG